MPTTRECDFCGADIEPGTGTMYVAVTGEVTHFCSSKCEKNADLGREARDHEWTAAGQRVAPEPHGTVPEEAGDEPRAEPGSEPAPGAGADETEAEPEDADAATEPTVGPDLATIEDQGEPKTDDVPADEAEPDDLPPGEPDQPSSPPSDEEETERPHNHEPSDPEGPDDDEPADEQQ